MFIPCNCSKYTVYSLICKCIVYRSPVNLTAHSVPACQIEFTSKLNSDQLPPPPPAANLPPPLYLKSFTRLRNSQFQGFSLFVSRPSEQIRFGIQFDTKGGKLGSPLENTLKYYLTLFNPSITESRYKSI